MPFLLLVINQKCRRAKGTEQQIDKVFLMINQERYVNIEKIAAKSVLLERRNKCI